MRLAEMAGWLEGWREGEGGEGESRFSPSIGTSERAGWLAGPAAGKPALTGRDGARARSFAQGSID